MKRIGKIFLLVVLLSLAIVSALSVASLAVDEASSISITGARRVHYDFTGVIYDYHTNEDGGVAASPQTKLGSLDLFEAVSKKYGQLRTVRTPDGNTVLDLTFHADYTGNLPSANDVVVSAAPKQQSLADCGYFVVEFDMSSRSSFPGDICVLIETRVFSADMRREISTDYRRRSVMGSYDAASGAWSFGEDRLTLKESEWVHVSIVTKMNPIRTYSEEGERVNYASSEARIYLNGVYSASVYPFAFAELDPSFVPVLHYAGVGYEYGKAHTGQRAGDSITLDNCTYTCIDSDYAENDTDRLSKLFDTEEPVRTITDLGEEILYTSDYTFPSPVALALYKTENDEKLPAADFDAALRMIKADENENATVTLYANHYRKVVIDYPVTVELNGFSLQNGWEVDPSFAVDYDAEEGILRVYEDPALQASVSYYDAPYGTHTDPVYTKRYALGREVSLSCEYVAPSVVVNGKEGFTPTGEVVIYDDAGEVVSLGEITEQNLGKLYHAYPVYERVTLAENIAFYTVIDSRVSFYSERDLWAASVPAKEELISDNGEERVSVSYPKAMPDGALIVLCADCTLGAPLYTLGGTLRIDLGGYQLSSDVSFATTGAQRTVTTKNILSGESTSKNEYFITNMQIFVYSTKENASLNTQNADLISADFNIGSLNGVDYFFGYESEGVVSPERIGLSFGARLTHAQKGSFNTASFANAVIHSTTTDGNGFIVDAQSRGRCFYFEDCEIFLENHLAASDANAATKEIYFKRTSIYGNTKNNLSHLVDHGAYTPESANAATTSGVITISLEDSTVYNMGLGEIRLEGYHKPKGSDTATHCVTETKLIVDRGSQISCDPEGVSNFYEGMALIAKPTVKTINGTDFVSLYGWMDAQTKTASFEIYDITFDQLTDDSVPTSVQRIALGYWFASVGAPSGESFYDPGEDAEHLITPAAYAVYDADGNVISKAALSESDADTVYRVCIYYDKTPIAFNVKHADGTYDAFTENDIGGALGISVISKINQCVLETGAIVTLYADCTTSGVLVGLDSFIDLNGHTLYSEHKLASFGASAGKTLFVYSSREGARICQTPTIDSGSGYVVEARNDNAKIYIGYESASKRSEFGIEVFCGAFAELRGAASELYLAGLTVCANGRDNYGFLNVRGGTDTTRAFFLEDCEIYSNRGGFFSIREGSASGSLTMKNTNLYATASAGLFSWYESRQEPITANIYMQDSGIWGKVTLGGLENGLGVATLFVSGDCTLSAVTENVVLTDADQSFVPTLPVRDLSGIKAPQSGIYASPESVLFALTICSGYTVGKTEDFKESVYLNVSLDTSVVINFYVPAVKELSSVMLGEENLLDTTRTESIEGRSFFVISLMAPPKLGDTEFELSVCMKDGTSIAFSVSLARYAAKLFDLVCDDNPYLEDSKRLMKYILTYIKEVAIRYGDADEEGVFSSLGDFTVNTDIEITEPVHDTASIKPYLTHVALDLDAYTGFAFKVAEGFIGSVSISLSGLDALECSYTEQAPAKADEIIVLENIPVHLLRGDVEITVTTATGEIVRASFNLATYAASYDEAYLKALYAYAIAAKEYNAKYPTVSTAK